MTIYDISMEIHEDMMVYKNKESKKPIREVLLNYQDSGINESKIFMDLHTGTHIDAPYHMLEDGETIEKMDVSKLIRKVKVLDLSDVNDRITDRDLQKKDVSQNEFVLFKTKNSFTDEYVTDFVFLDKSGATYLRDKGVQGVGIDALGIERSQPDHATHKILMGSDCIIIEGLRLKDITEGDYIMHALPLKIRCGDGAPARVVLSDV
ncbi:MAG: cyclase family protein [Clostridiales bacterium]|nr:cyclase family protein [Clostridiales bacterium]